MVASLSLPNWREDQPGPDVLESEKVLQSGTPYGAPNPMAPVHIGIPAMQRQFQNQQDYQNYFNTISALQQRNMGLQGQENQINAIDKLSNANNLNPQLWKMVAPSFGGLIPEPTPEFQAAADTAFNTNMREKLLAAAGKASEGGFQLPGGALNLPTAPGSAPLTLQQGDPAIVRAAQERAAGEVNAIRTKNALDLDQTKTFSTRNPDGTYTTMYQETTSKRSTPSGAASGAPPGLNAAIPPPGGKSYVGKENPLLGNLPNPADNASAPTAPPANAPPVDGATMVKNGIDAARARDPSMAADMQAGMKANGNKAVVTRPNGDIMVIGASGRAYKIGTASK